MEAPREITKPKILIGEGIEEVRFFQAMLKHLGIEDILVEEYSGKQKLSSFIKNLPLRPGFSRVVSLGVTRDADDNAETAFQNICGALTHAKLPTPAMSGKSEGNNPKVSAFVLPDGKSQGMLEDLCLRSVQFDLATQCVEEYLNCAQEKTGRQISNLSKARVRVWLASQTRPDLRLGEAAEKGYWQWDDQAFDQIKDFLVNL